jgi:hypothetical protein
MKYDAKASMYWWVLLDISRSRDGSEFSILMGIYQSQANSVRCSDRYEHESAHIRHRYCQAYHVSSMCVTHQLIICLPSRHIISFLELDLPRLLILFRFVLIQALAIAVLVDTTFSILIVGTIAFPYLWYPSFSPTL